MRTLYSFLILIAVTIGTNAQSGVPFNGMVFDAAGAPLKNVRIYVHDSHKYSRSDKIDQVIMSVTQLMTTNMPDSVGAILPIR